MRHIDVKQRPNLFSGLWKSWRNGLSFPHCGKKNRELGDKNGFLIQNHKNYAKNCLRFLRKSGKLKSVDEHPHKHNLQRKIKT